MSAEIVGLNITRGSSFNIRITVYDDNSDIVDLTGYEVRGVVKNRYSDADADILINLDPVVHDAVNGLIDISLTSVQTSQLPITEALYDIEKFSISGQEPVDKIMKGTVLVHPEVTSGDDAAYGGINPTTPAP